MHKQSKQKAAKASATPRRAIFASVLPITAAPDLQEQKFVGYSCASCKTTFAMNPITAGEGDEGLDAVSPICPDCGSDSVIADEAPLEEENIEFLDDDNAIAMACHKCEAHLLVTASTLTTFKSNKITCSICGTANAFDPAELLPEGEDAVADVEGDDEEVDLDFADDDIGDVELEGDDGFDLTDEVDEEATADEADDVELQDIDGDGDVEPIQATADDDVEQPFDGDTVETEEPADKIVNAAEETDDLDLIDALESEDEEATASFVRVGDRVLAMVGDHVVGVRHRKDVLASQQEAFDSPQYVQALVNSVRAVGVAGAMDQFGFKRNTIKVNAAKLGALSEARVIERAEALASNQNTEFADHFRACMGIAAVGMNKGFWPGARNAVKEALASSLQQAGVRGAQRLLDQAFASANDSYHKALQAKAMEILAMPIEARNAVAEAVQGMAYASGITVANDENEDEQDDSQASTIARAVGQPVRKAAIATAATEHTAPAKTEGVHAMAQAIRGITGGRVF